MIPLARESFLALALAGALAAAPLRQDGPRDRFETRLAEAQAKLQGRKFAVTRELLLALLRDQPEEDFVLCRWFEIEDALAQASFWKDYSLPDPEDVVGGKLEAYEPSSGKIRLRYRSRDGDLDPPVVAPKDAFTASASESQRSGDFFGTQEVFLHPMVFKGPYEIELKGQALSSAGKLPSVLVAWEWASLRGLDYGSSYAVTFGEPTSVFEFEGGEFLQLATSPDKYALNPGRPYSFKVIVAAGSVTAGYNEKVLARAERRKGPFGQFGFTSFENLDEVVVSGEIEPAWIAGLIDERVQRDWQAFRERFDPFAELPAWLEGRVHGADQDQKAAEFGLAAPRPDHPGNAAALARAAEFHRKGEFEPGLEYARSLGKDQLAEELRVWLQAHFLASIGRWEEALAHCDRVCAADRQFYEARLLRARLISGLRSADDALRELEQLAQDFPTHAEPYEELIGLHLVEGRQEKAFEILEQAVHGGVPPRALAAAGRTLLRARQGPRFGRSYVYESKNYRVVSDVGEKACFEIAGELEQFLQKYSIHLRRPERRDRRKFLVYFFAGESGYHAYTADLLGDPAEHTLGLYQPMLEQLLLWNAPDKRTVLRTARHEGFHQYLHQVASAAPTWLHEGMAQYFEQARLVGGRWKDDQVDELKLAVLRRLSGEWTHLRDLVYGEAHAFRARSDLHYPQAWAFVHFLANGGAKPRKQLEALFDALVDGADRREALDRAFEEVDWGKLEREFEEYVDGLK